jgi:enoyl-[acyl-carrier protein] reductase I
MRRPGPASRETLNIQARAASPPPAPPELFLAFPPTFANHDGSVRPEVPTMTLLQGKRGAILGIANKNSIAWGITEAMHAAGAQLAFNFLNERMEPKVKKLTDEIPGALTLPCDVTKDDEIDAFFGGVSEHFGGRLDFLVHSIAYAEREDLTGRFVDTSRGGFVTAMEISAYSLVAVAQRALPLMEAAGGGSIMTLTYYGSEKAVAGYNVMGVAKAALEACVRYMALDLGANNIRVNALSPGPMNTLSARGIRGFTDMLHLAAERAPLKRNVSMQEVGATAVFLASDGASGITGEVLHIDAGYNVVGL